MTMADTLRTIPLFRKLRETDIDRICVAAREKAYPKDTIIAFQADAEDALYIVLKGRVKIVLISEDGREVILSTRSDGDFFGEMSLLDDVTRTNHVIAMESSTLLVLKREDFQQCLEEMPGMAIGLFRALCQRLRDADERIGGLVLLDVPGRLAKLLLGLAEEDDGSHVSKRPTHAMMAQMVGSSRETVSRTMRTFEEQGVIEASRGKLVITNRAALEAAAGSAPAMAAAEPETARRRRTDQVGEG